MHYDNKLLYYIRLHAFTVSCVFIIFILLQSSHSSDIDVLSSSESWSNETLNFSDDEYYNVDEERDVWPTPLQYDLPSTQLPGIAQQTSSQNYTPSTLAYAFNNIFESKQSTCTSTSQLTQPPQSLTSTPPSLPSSSQPQPSKPLSQPTSQCTSQPSIQQECKL